MSKKKAQEQVPNEATILQEELTYDTKTIITVLLLVTVYPIGLILVYKWMQWPKWLKIVLAVPLIPFVVVFLFLVIGIFGAAF